MKCIIADAGPMIALTKANQLGLLNSLFEQVFIANAVYEELDSQKDSALASIDAAIQQGWICLVDVDSVDSELESLLDPGEASSISYSLNHNLIPILMDEKKGRHYAKNMGIPVIGTAGILILAKQKNLIPLIKPLMIEMRQRGYWLSDKFIATVANIVDE